jgi:hypothetical protein
MAKRNKNVSDTCGWVVEHRIHNWKQRLLPERNAERREACGRWARTFFVTVGRTRMRVCFCKAHESAMKRRGIEFS